MRRFILCIAALAMSVCLFATNPCSKYQTDGKRFVAHGTGLARHLSTAKIKAQMAANVKLTEEVQTWINSLTEKYIAQCDLDSAVYTSVFNSICKQRIEEILNYASVLCDKKGDARDDMLVAYIALEVGRKEVCDLFARAFAADGRLINVFDQSRFLAMCKSEIRMLSAK